MQLSLGKHIHSPHFSLLDCLFGRHHGQLSGSHWRNILTIGFRSFGTLRGALWAPRPSDGISHVRSTFSFWFAFWDYHFLH